MDLSSYFPETEIVYLNSGTLSRTPRSVLEAVQKEQWLFEKNPTQALFACFPKLWEVQKDLANFFGAQAKDLFFRHNITAALNTFFFCYPWRQGGEILVGDYEYGATVNLIKVMAAQRGIKVRSFSLPQASRATKETLLAAVVQELRPETQGLCLSHVCTAHGLVLPIVEIAAETRKRNIIFAVDGAHGIAALPLKFSECEDIDFYGGNLHKWFMGPKGTAFGWMPERVRKQLQFNYGGWASFAVPPLYRDFGEGDPTVANLLPPGCHDVAPFFAIAETLRFWREHGEEQIRGRVFELQAILETQMDKELGWERLSPPLGPLRGPLLAYRLPEGQRKKGESLSLEILKKSGVQVHTPALLGETILRFSPGPALSNEELSDGCGRLLPLLRSLD